MPGILQRISFQQLKDLLLLFSADSISEEWTNIQGFKDDKCSEIAGIRDVTRISSFINREINSSKQHVYVFHSNISVEELLELSIESFELIYDAEEGDRWEFTYLATIPLEIILNSDPPQKIKIEYLLPVKIELYERFLLVRFIKFERNFRVQNFDSSKIYYRKVDHEKQLLGHISQAFMGNRNTFEIVDVHKGIKHLWDTDYLDGTDISYKTDHSRDSKKMDDKRGIKQYNLEGYQKIKENELLTGLFIKLVEDENIPPEFGVNWIKGCISFNKFSKNKEELDDVVREILKHNS